MTSLRVKPLDVHEPGSFAERARILRELAAIRDPEMDYIAGQMRLDALLRSRLETTDGSDLDDALAEASAAEVDALTIKLLATEVPTPSAEN